MIQNITQGAAFGPHPLYMSLSDITYQAWGAPGPAIFFRSPSGGIGNPDLVQVENLQGRRY